MSALNGAKAESRQRIDWDAVREQYVTGTESYADIAKRLGVALATVKRHACPGPKERAKQRAREFDRFRALVMGTSPGDSFVFNGETYTKDPDSDA